MNVNDLHCPYDKILLRDFFNHIALIGYHLYNERFESNGSIVSWCIEKLIEDNILPCSCNVQGYFYSDVRKTINILPNMVKAYEIYKFMCSKRTRAPYDSSITLRIFLNILNDFKLLDGKLLTTKEVIDVMSSDNPIVYDAENSYNLDLEMTFLEFFEILIGCALKYNTKKKLNKKRSLTSKMTSNPDNGHIEQILDIPEIVVNEVKDNEKNDGPELEEMSDHEDKSSRKDDEKQSANTNNMKLSAKLSVKSLTNEDELDFDIWIEKNDYFFNQIFFPSAERFNAITKMVNISL